MRPYALLLLLVGLLGAGVPSASAGGDEDDDAPATPQRPDTDQPDLDLFAGLVMPADLAPLAEEMASFAEDVEDLEEPVDEFAQFDQCMFLIGISSFGGPDAPAGFRFARGTQLQQRPAFAVDIRGLEASQFNFLAFPGEEPPQIECNEDASGESTDE